MSDVRGRLRAEFIREAHEALEEAIRLCERADRLHDDVFRLNARLAIAGGGHTLGHTEVADRAVALEQLVSLFRHAADLLVGTTWCWAQTINDEALTNRQARFG